MAARHRRFSRIRLPFCDASHPLRCKLRFNSPDDLRQQNHLRCTITRVTAIAAKSAVLLLKIGMKCRMPGNFCRNSLGFTQPPHKISKLTTETAMPRLTVLTPLSIASAVRLRTVGTARGNDHQPLHPLQAIDAAETAQFSCIAPAIPTLQQAGSMPSFPAETRLRRTRKG